MQCDVSKICLVVLDVNSLMGYKFYKKQLVLVCHLCLVAAGANGFNGKYFTFSSLFVFVSTLIVKNPLFSGRHQLQSFTWCQEELSTRRLSKKQQKKKKVFHFPTQNCIVAAVEDKTDFLLHYFTKNEARGRNKQNLTAVKRNGSSLASYFKMAL